jgi:hypothetical protein
MNGRWRFCSYGGPGECSQREEVVAKIDAWWQQFQGKTCALNSLFSQEAEWDLPEWMATHLQAIHPSLMWEYGPAVNTDGHRLVITPESAHHLRPLTDTIIERAPKIEGWEFYAYRLPEDLETAEVTVEARTGGDIRDVEVRVTRGDHHFVDICFCSPRTSGDDDEDALGESFVAAETLLGEECLDKWIGSLEISPKTKRGGLSKLFGRGEADTPRMLPLDRLKDTVDALVGSIRDQLPQQPHYQWVDEAEWTVWELTPREADDYPEQYDLFVGKSANAPMWTAAHGNGLFYSERFTRCGETFCYVKIDGSEGLDEEEFADKAEIEDALDEVLKPDGLGCQIGGGTGVRYSYVDLALVDLPRGIEAVRKRLQQGNLTKRSWIQFFDAGLAAEWIGIYDDSPPPPMPPLDD